MWKHFAGIPTDPNDIGLFTFQRKNGRWYVQVPQYLEDDQLQNEIMLAEGAPKVLNLLAHGTSTLILRLALIPLPNSSCFELIQHCDPPKGGGLYMIMSSDDESSLLWICDLALFAFGDIPDKFYIEKLTHPVSVSLAGHPAAGSIFFR